MAGTLDTDLEKISISHQNRFALEARALASDRSRERHLQETKDSYKKYSSLDFCKRMLPRFAAFQDITPCDLADSLHTTPRGEKVWCGIRFENVGAAGVISPEKSPPFIAALASHERTGPNEIHDILDTCKSLYSNFGPRQLQIQCFSSELPKLSCLEHKVDQYIVAGKGEGLCKDERLAEMVQVPDLAKAVTIYDELYTDFEKHDQEMFGVVYKQSSEAIRSSADQGYFFAVHGSSGWKAMIAGSEKPLYGFNGVLIIAEHVKKEAQGRGLAKVLQRGLSQKAPSEAFIWGEISSKNPRSLISALGVGRKIVGARVFIPMT